jgi:hypothetical protein
MGAKTLKSDELFGPVGVIGEQVDMEGVRGVSSPLSVSLLTGGRGLGYVLPGRFLGFIPGDFKFNSGHLRG